MRLTLFSILLLGIFSSASSQTLYDESTIQTLNIFFSQSNWDYMLDTAKAGSEGYIMADSVYINGIAYDSVGVKYKGNSSYNASQTKNPWHIEFDTYKDQNYQGYKDIKLSNISYDPSFVREAVAYKVLSNYMDCPEANYMNVYVNSSLMGLYTNTEAINKTFVKDRFGSKTNAFFSCSPPGGAGPTSTNLPNLEYLGTNSASYEDAYEMKSDTGWNDLIDLTYILSNTNSTNTANLEAVLDVDRAIWMLAFDNLFVNLDSYIGEFKQNYYLYKSDNGQFIPIVWDLNMSFGVFAMTGSTTTGGGPGGGGPGGGGPGGSTNLSTTDKKELDHTLHDTETDFPLVQKLLGIPTYKKRYLAHYKTILTEMVQTSAYVTDANTFKNLILSSVSADLNKFSYQSTTNMTNNIASTDISVGTNTAPGLTGLMSGRNTYLSALSDFTNTQPTISSVTPSTSTPTLGATVSITANVTNTTTSSVYLGYRNHKHDIFVKTQMYDDGAHGDGAAGDNVYGADITISDYSTQYYIYAENTNIGAFSPARAEYEYYELSASSASAIAAGDLVINEIMASNAVTATDSAGDYEDWLELYNNSSSTLTLDDLYATDDATDLLKWQFPAGTTIAPGEYLIVWADGDTAEAGLHADFKFSSNGEDCVLSYANGDVVDSTTFGAQTTDLGYARVPNGTGSFVIQTPTFASNNDSATVVVVPTTIDTIAFGDLVINELMASNETTAVDDDGEYEDWLELFNNTADTLSLDGLYATDDATDLTQWPFPTGTTIAPGEYLIVWADNDVTQTGLHANFKFSSGGESCFLSYGNGVYVDSTSFGAQTDDMGYARVPNGTGSFVIQDPTFSYNNDSVVVVVTPTSFDTIAFGDLAINEIMASNETTASDDDGEFEDWIELYNNSTDTLSLDGLYATDEATDLTQWAFPTGTTIAPGEYLIVWADNDVNQSGLHTNFKFSSGGESCYLSYGNGVYVDSTSFGAQTDDMGYARVPNGTGSFVIQDPTFAYNNDSTTVVVVPPVVAVDTIAFGDLALNEIMASNISVTSDENGIFSDWIELYNNSTDTLSLDSLYASDDYADLTKWKFPAGTTLAPASYLILWADSDFTDNDLHTNFDFDISGGTCLLSYADGTVVDSITFGMQTDDKAYARVPNGTGSFVIQNETFSYNNDEAKEDDIPDGINDLELLNLNVYPNPTDGLLTIVSDNDIIENVKILNIQGQILYQNEGVNSTKITIDLSSYTNGVYFLKVNNQTNLKLIKN